MKTVDKSGDCTVIYADKYAEFVGGVFDSEAKSSCSSENLPAQLQPILPAECDGNVPLGDALIAQLTGRIMNYLHELCDERGSCVDFEYWRNITHRILSLRDCSTISVVPSQAGSGKSTWILAFILAVSESLLGDPELLNTLGGVLLVVQKVEDLENFAEQIHRRFPDSPTPLMVAMQSFSTAAQKRGLCINDEVKEFRECSSKTCPQADSCPLLAMMGNAHNVPILGMTQARYTILRNSGDLPFYLDGGDGAVCRRFLLYDEKPDLFPSATVSIPIVNSASSEIERADYLGDRTRAYLQRRFSYLVSRPVHLLRQMTQQTARPSNCDPDFGLCSLDICSESDEQEEGTANREFGAFCKLCADEITHETPSLRACLKAVAQLLKSDGLFDKRSEFSITTRSKNSVRFDRTLQVVFDATATVDGDYLHLPNAEILPQSPVVSMKHVTLHIYSGDAVNLSKQAFDSKSWLVDGLCRLVSEIVQRYPHPTFLSTYKTQSLRIYKALSDDVKTYLALMPDASKDAPLPYFGGTNGSNAFNHCRNVILLGYPRYSPSDYLRHTYLAWQSAGFTEELQAASDAIAEQDFHGNHKRRVTLPSVTKYESRHLAARYVQEIFRCAIRNGKQTEDIHIFLFAPPRAVLDLVKSQLPNCVVVEESLPEEFLRKQIVSRRYLDKPTAQAKFLEFLPQWDGKPLLISELRTRLEISDSAWSSLRKSEKFKTLCTRSGIEFIGRGKSAKIVAMSNVA